MNGSAIRRGRWIITTYIVLHLAMIGFVLFVALRRPRRMSRLLLRCLSQAVLLHSLWKGSRWAQWLHVLGFVMLSVGSVMVSLRRPGQFTPMLGVGLALISSLFAWLFAFSTSVRAFLAYQRGELAEDGTPMPRGLRPVPVPVPINEADVIPPPGMVVCTACGTAMKEFVLVCPDCGHRRRGT